MLLTKLFFKTRYAGKIQILYNFKNKIGVLKNRNNALFFFKFFFLQILLP